jgi:hypothetical protein
VATDAEATLACPHCGTVGLANLFYVEDVPVMRDLVRLEGGTLVTRSPDDDVMGDGRNPRLGCKTCDRDCAIPETIDVDYDEEQEPPADE